MMYFVTKLSQNIFFKLHVCAAHCLCGLLPFEQRTLLSQKMTLAMHQRSECNKKQLLLIHYNLLQVNRTIQKWIFFAEWLNSIPVIFKINTPQGTCCTGNFPCVTSKFWQKGSVTGYFALQVLNFCIRKLEQNELFFQCNIDFHVVSCKLHTLHVPASLPQFTSPLQFLASHPRFMPQLHIPASLPCFTSPLHFPASLPHFTSCFTSPPCFPSSLPFPSLPHFQLALQTNSSQIFACQGQILELDFFIYLINI